MREIPLNRSLFVFWEDVVFLESALLASDETSALAAPVTDVLDQFPTILERHLGTRRTVIQASARGSVADAGIDGGIRELFSGVLHLVGQNRKAVEFTTLFNSHIGDVVRHALRKQVEVGDELVRKLGMKIYADDFRARYLGVLQPFLARGKSVIEEQRQAEVARVEGRLDVQGWKEEANAIRLSIYSQLLSLAAQTKRKKAWAEAFFVKPSRRGAVEQGGEEEDGSDESPEE
ncbi:MAG TPA: hypothetical protein VLS89_18665 [Candidatus Nanopelagicales bacterium]|nr:hypothetical protein [Candidatus Nanopelagicales bacterium]